MATVSWTTESGKETKKHIQGGSNTLCGLDIPGQRLEWSAFGIPDCKKCLKKQEMLNRK